MRRKILLVIGVIFVLFVLQSCKSHPEESLLRRYFHAVSLNDLTTLSTMAIEPIAMDVAEWEIIKVGEEKSEPAILPELDKQEKELKKKLEDHIGPTMDAKDQLDLAKDELDSARTAAAKTAAKKKVDEMQAKYDQEFALHKQLQKDYNDAKAAAAREEEVSSFSLGAGELPNLREMTGIVFTKQVEVRIKTKAGATKNYIFHLRKNDLKDETLNKLYRGRWIIIKFETLG